MYTLSNNIVFDTIYFIVVYVDFVGTHMASLVCPLKLVVTSTIPLLISQKHKLGY